MDSATEGDFIYKHQTGTRKDENMEEKKKIIVVARTEGIEIVVEGEEDTDDYELLLSKSQAMELAMNILNTLYKTGTKM